MKQDKTYKECIQTLTNRHGQFDETMISLWPNQIEVQLLNNDTNYSDWDLWKWEQRVLQLITAFVKPFEDLLSQTVKHISHRQRCIDEKCKKESYQSKGSDTHEGAAIAVFQFTDEAKLHVAASEDTLKQVRQSYPTIDISCDTGMKTVTLRGPAFDAYQATEDMCSLVKSLTKNPVFLDQEKMQVLNNLNAQKRIQRTLSTNNILCFWEICELFGSDIMIMVTAAQNDQPRVKQVFESSFQTIKLPFDESLKSILQSDAWKLCQGQLQTSTEGELAPVVDVSDNEIAITGFAANIESSRRAVLGFFHRNVVQTYPQLYGQGIQVFITGLEPWQMKFLLSTELKERINETLPDKAQFDIQPDTVVIRAPLRVLTESVSRFWRFVASLSQKQIHLTTALAQMYWQPSARSKVQTLLKAAGLTCHWTVQDVHITVSAEDADQERLMQFFTSAFSEVHVPVAPVKSNLLRSWEFQSLITDLQERKSGSPTPVIKISPVDTCVIIVDVYERCVTVQRAIQKFFDDYEVILALQKKTQARCPQQENFAAKTKIEEIQTERKNLCSTEQQTNNRQLESKEQQTQDNSCITVEKEQQTERPMLTENGFQTDKITTQEQQLQTDQSQLESTGQQTDDSKKATNDKRLQTERGNVQVEVIHTEEKHHQTEVKHSQNTAQQTENRQLKNAELHTDDSRVVTVETQTEGATFTETGFQTENVRTDEKQLQTDQRESNSKQQQTESKGTENKETQAASNATITTENQTQTEGQRTEGQTEERNTKAHAQGEECELIENPGTATLVPASLDNEGPSSQTEWKRTNETALSVNQFQVQMVQTRNVQSQAHQCPVELPSSNPSSVHADLDTNTCVDEIQAEESTSDDESQTFPKRIIESEVEMGLDTRTQTSVPPCREALPQHLSCLTVEQLLELCARLGVSPEHLQHLQSSCTDPEDLMRNLVDRCIAASDSTGLLLAVLRLFVRTDDTNTSRNPDTRGLPALHFSAVATTPHVAVRNIDEHPDQSQSPEVVASGWRVSAETAQAAYPPLSSTEGNTFSETQPFSATLHASNNLDSADSLSAFMEAPELETVVSTEQSSPLSQSVCLPSAERGEQEHRQTCREPALQYNGSQQPSLPRQRQTWEQISMTTETHLAALYSGELSEAHNRPTQQTVEPERGVTSHGRQSLSRTDQHLEPGQMPMTLRMAQMQMSPSSPIRLNHMPSSPFQANVDLCLEIHLHERPATDTNALMQVLADTVDSLRRDVDMYIHNELPVDNLSNSSSELSHEALE